MNESTEAPAHRPRRRAIPTRRAIVQAAVELFGDKGYDGTTVQEIVDRAGVTKGAFYHNFKSKDELLLVIHDEFIDYCLRGTARIRELDLPPAEALAAIMEQMTVIAGTYSNEISIFLRERRHLSDDLFAEVRQKRDAFENDVVRLVEDVQAANPGLELGAPRLLAFGIIGLCSWVCQWFHPNGMAIESVGTMYSDVVIRGLCGVPPDRSQPIEAALRF